MNKGKPHANELGVRLRGSEVPQKCLMKDGHLGCFVWINREFLSNKSQCCETVSYRQLKYSKLLITCKYTLIIYLGERVSSVGRTFTH